MFEYFHMGWQVVKIGYCIYRWMSSGVDLEAEAWFQTVSLLEFQLMVGRRMTCLYKLGGRQESRIHITLFVDVIKWSTLKAGLVAIMSLSYDFKQG